MRTCRYRLCRQPFLPPKPNHYFCSWDCHEKHYAEPGHDYRGYQRGREQSYEHGFWDGVQAGPRPTVTIPPGIWKGLVALSHPDKWQIDPGLVALATEVTRWLLAHRPPESKGGS